jgi:hypothetical protein
MDAGGARDSGTPAGTPVEALRAATVRYVAADCACTFEDSGFASVEDCAAFGRLAEVETCEDTAYAATAATSEAALTCQAAAFTGYADCTEPAGCDEAAIDVCLDALVEELIACETDDAYDEAVDACIVENVVGTEPSTCPEGKASSTVGEAVFTGTTLLAGDDVTPECSVEGSPDRVFEWTAPEAGIYTFDTNGSSYDTVLALLDGCDGAELACDDDAEEEDIGLRSRVTLTVEAAQSVFVVVDGYGSGAGTFQVNVSLAASP